VQCRERGGGGGGLKGKVYISSKGGRSEELGGKGEG